MYSGNQSYVHQVDTLIQAALELKHNKNFLFVFIGTGIRKKEVTAFKEKYGLDNIVQLPYQPRNKIHISLAAADIQVVIMGDGLVGYTHPNKIYGALYLGKPILYIGPEESHITGILEQLDGNLQVKHKEVQQLKKILLDFDKLPENTKRNIGKNNQEYTRRFFAPEVLKERMVRVIEEHFRDARWD